MLGVGKVAASLRELSSVASFLTLLSHLPPTSFLPSPPGNSCAKSLPSGSSLAASVATGIYLPGSGITERGWGWGSRLREDLGPGREDRTRKRRAGAGPRGQSKEKAEAG